MRSKNHVPRPLTREITYNEIVDKVIEGVAEDV